MKIFVAIGVWLMVMSQLAFAQEVPICGPTSGLQWMLNNETDMALYRVYVMDSPLSVEIGVSPVAKEVTHDLSKVVTLPDGSKVLQGGLAEIDDGLYYFSVTAVDTSGNESGPSNEVVCNVQLPPLPPTGLTVTIQLSNP